MSVWLTPDLKPVFGGTYFPPEGGFGRPGFRQLLEILGAKWNVREAELRATGENMYKALKKQEDFVGMGPGVIGLEDQDEVGLETTLIRLMFTLLESRYEEKFGGFGFAPKFPQPSLIDFLLAYASCYVKGKSHEYEAAVNMVSHTLTMMARGGIHDHIAQGFARYSTDDEWHVPHFEKMLYDQGQLAVSYCNAYLLTKDEFLAEIVRDILTYVGRDLNHPLGGFFSAEDADSYPTRDSKVKREGAFCVWTWDEIHDALGKETVNDSVSLAVIFCYLFDVKKGGNCDFEKDPHGELRNQNVLIMRTTPQLAAAKFDLSLPELSEVIERCKKILYERRQQRPKPHLDNKMIAGWNGLMISAFARAPELSEVIERCKKILYERRQQRPKPHLDNKMIAGWNGLMISAFARAGAVLADAGYVDRAVKAANFMRKYMCDDDGMLTRSVYAGEKAGETSQLANPIPAFASDYAFLIQGLLDLYEASLDERWMEWAYKLQEVMDKLFWDAALGGYFESREGDPNILIRLKEDQDGGEPTANSVAVKNLLRLHASLGEAAMLTRALRIFDAYKPRLRHMPMALPQMFTALIMSQVGMRQVVVQGPRGSPATNALIGAVFSASAPNKALVFIDNKTGSSGFIAKKLGLSVGGPATTNGGGGGNEDAVARAHVCVDQACSAPTSDPDELLKQLSARNI
ncbi:unnamed protein product [Notodromas monacha]|uniref:Spermatogenesis-associated protein 20-like TRX domain-containing protein n=1 Tax=Notodromas monacha TaxID=399045 RepID=A0A7R9BWP5_9CRUS|nr:unnamed protein product [Notodromas monacha]CAG0921794.1 unnamed protein product [Notodromas monacha]